MSDHAVSALAVIRMLVLLVGVQLLPLLVSQRWSWFEAWLYAGIQMGTFVVSRVLVARVHPSLLRERAQALDKKDAKPWDRRVVLVMMLASTIALVVAGLEARGRSQPLFPLGVKVAAAVVLLAGDAFASWAILENRFFEGLVRIQRDRGHVVVTTGPYALIRHPGYAGALLAYLATPVLLDAPWSGVPMAVALAALVYRTSREDDTLRAELEGYEAYSTQTRFRLVPFVW